MIVIQYDLKPPATISWNLQSDMLRFQPEKKLEVARNYLKKIFSACNMQHKKNLLQHCSKIKLFWFCCCVAATKICFLIQNLLWLPHICCNKTERDDNFWTIIVLTWSGSCIMFAVCGWVQTLECSPAAEKNLYLRLVVEKRALMVFTISKSNRVSQNPGIILKKKVRQSKTRTRFSYDG